MFNKTFIFILLSIIALQTYGQIDNYNRGDIINNFTVTDTDGQTYTLYDILNQGKYVYIDFFATNCGTCQTKMPVFNAFYDKYGCNAGDVFCISIEVANHNNAEVIAFEQQYGGNTNHAPAVSTDGGSAAVVTDFGISSFPVICGIDPQKKLFVENVRPVSDVYDLAQSFPQGFNPPAMSCSNTIIPNFESKIHIFPNPVTHNLHINTTGYKNFNITIFDINAIKVYQQSFNNTSVIIDLKNVALKNGLYFVEIKNNKQIYYQKIIINQSI